VVGFEISEQASLTDVGVRRSHNQDAYGVMLAGDTEAWQDRGHLILVADGMGAHAVGEMASKMAADLILHNYQKHANLGPQTALRRAFAEANTTIHQRGLQNQEFKGMGTTGTCLVVRPEGAWLAHVGDSRCYRIRSGQVEQISFDHSLQWELARRQQIDPAKLTGIPSNVIVRSLGPESQVQVDIEGPHVLMPGDIFLLCSDGLSNQVSDQELGATVTALPLEEACQYLVDMANYHGGPDNITIVTVRLAGKPPSDPSSEQPAMAKPKPSLWQTLPWAGIAFGSGITLAIMALVLQLGLQATALAIVTFIFALGMLVAGFIGLYKAAQKPPPLDPEDEASPPQVHRRASCRIDEALVKKTMQTEAKLQELIRENGWTVPWAKHAKHLQASTAYLQKGDLRSAYREQCRAITVLTSAIRDNREKSESFRPNW
jgi:protein phosphatase